MQCFVYSSLHVCRPQSRYVRVHRDIYIYKTEKTFKNEQRSRDAAAKKELIQVESGKLIIIVRISINLFTTSHTHLLLTMPTSHTHRFHTLSKIVIHTSAHPYCTEVWMTILESGWNLCVWLVGMVSRMWVWLVVKRYIDILTIIINFSDSTCINSFFAAASLLLCSFKKYFSVLFL